jgi:hypothetical protein
MPTGAIGPWSNTVRSRIATSGEIDTGTGWCIGVQIAVSMVSHSTLVLSIPPQPSAPRAPVHRCILVHLRGFKISVSQFICQTELLVSLILGWTTNVGLVVHCVRKHVVGLSFFWDQSHFAGWKCLQFLCLCGGGRDDHFEARGDALGAFDTN